MARDLGHEGTSVDEGTAVLEGAMGTKANHEIGVEKKSGLRFPRLFTRAGVNPFDEVEWELRSAGITNEHGKVVFEQKDVEFPKFWSQMATNVVTSKYFRGQIGTPGRERSVKQLIGRVAKTIAGWGRTQAYFASEMDAQAFEDELTHILLHQKASFNSPVWFNCGVETKPQCSACFINSVGDTMEGILNLAKTEGLLFKWGSGTGTNFSALRSSREHIGGGGTASGPVSFMKGFDAFAGVIKSGGRTRRAAKMVILNADHPDIVDYIKCKAEEEKKAWTLIDAGYDPSLNGPAYASIFFQNSNNSVRVTDEFMQAVENDGEWTTHAVTDGRPMDTYKARDLMNMICDAAHQCGDPGLQFDTTVNDWHTCSNTARINASNPCSEYMFLDDSACNLASVNLMKFVRGDGSFDTGAYKHVCGTLITAQEIVVDNASYPTPMIEKNSHDYRPLGLGYANLGALLMSWGVPYDSAAGRAVAGALTALMHGHANATSARIAAAKGPFAGYEKNREPMLRVIRKHHAAVEKIEAKFVPGDILEAARETWKECEALGVEHGYRNAQVTVIAPTGTIAFMMDCDTTGIEPDIALVKYKKLAGGGMLKIVNNTVPEALRRLGYGEEAVNRIVRYIDEHETIEGAPGLKDEHLPVFDCAFKPRNGTRSIHYLGHIRMMEAVQPFISGAISKTVNMPEDATPQDIAQAYFESWKGGLKAVAVYRDGSKRSQPLSTSKDDKGAQKPALQVVQAPAVPKRRRLPDERKSITHKFSVANHDGYLTVGMYEDGTPGEIFIVMAKAGSTLSGVMDSFATAVSLGLQHGVPLELFVSKFAHVRFEPHGFTKNGDIPIAKSIVDYIFRWLGIKFLGHHPASASHEAAKDDIFEAGGVKPVADTQLTLINGGTNGGTNGGANVKSEEDRAFVSETDAPPCSECGSIMVRRGACYACLNCGTTSGCS
ncbi:MAG TPA: vitamin B12-dependent ribonucleotide reductase [Candidatus Eisenbacteria bacterium]|nr:vitamin B12-dependent ribonucleotide reductase [Candidatus Eisenbacteria bacterium]